MKIIVPIKQVPETNNVKMDPVTGTMIREVIESIYRCKSPQRIRRF